MSYPLIKLIAASILWLSLFPMAIFWAEWRPTTAMAFIFGITLASVLWDAHGLIKRVSMAEVQVELFTKDCLVSNGDLFYVGKNEDKWIAGCKVKESVVAQ